MADKGASARRQPAQAAPTNTPENRLNLSVVAMPGFDGYQLLDSGAGRKLEQFADIVLDRPEPQALWQPRLSKAHWSSAHAVFSASQDYEEKGRWRIDKPVPDSWPVPVGPVTMQCRLQGLWHVGLFPEQKPHWDWMLQRIANARGERPRVLNLFAYTGAASLLAAAAGAEVTHVDASKKAIAWAKENQAASKLKDAPIRWILDDAAKFTAREVRRQKTYDIILVDPPKFGRGPGGEVWDLFTNLPDLMSNCAKLLAPSQASMVLTVYAIRASTLAFGQLCQDCLADRPGQFETGELVIQPASGHAVPTSLFTRWTSE